MVIKFIKIIYVNIVSQLPKRKKYIKNSLCSHGEYFESSLKTEKLALHHCSLSLTHSLTYLTTQKLT